MTNAEKIGTNQHKLNIKVAAKDFNEKIQQAYVKTRAKYNIPGFRKGKATQKMIEKMYGESVFFEAAFDLVYWDAFVAAAQEAGIVPVDAPDIEILVIQRDKDLEFNATVFVKPTVQLDQQQYSGIEIEKVEYTVSDEMVQNEISKQQEKLSRLKEVTDRAVKDGDTVIIDYSGSVDGVAFDGGTAQNQTLVIGSNQFIPGFEPALIGMALGQEKDIDLTFPSEYHSKELAGAKSVFKVKINEIKEKELPELDDEFAKDVSEFDTYKQYRDDIFEKLTKTAQNQSKTQLRNSAVDKIVENVELEIPEAMIERQVDRTIDKIKYQMQSQGIEFEQYLMYTGSDVQKIREEVRGESRKKVCADLILEAIVEKEKIVANENDVEKEIQALAKSISKTTEETKKLLSKADMASIKIDLEIVKAIDFVLEKAKLVEPKKPEPVKNSNSEEDIRRIEKEVAQVLKNSKQ